MGEGALAKNGDQEMTERHSDTKSQATPRTDAQAFNLEETAQSEGILYTTKCSDGAYVSADFARKLERERDECLAVLELVSHNLTFDRSKSGIRSSQNSINKLMAKLNH